MASGRPLQLIRCGDDTDNYAFTLNEAHLDEVTGKVPKGTRVAVVSVVGAFRTGKSFLLTLILRYLRHAARVGDGDVTDAWLTEEGNKIVEGNNNAGDAGEGGPASFEWRGGRVRMTTGITVWSEPFLVTGADGEQLAVVVLDTQGLFDNETPMGLTSCIFGLSTLMSSYQIYNVSNRIQEDNLQQLAPVLALFTEYGRMAVDAQAQASTLAKEAEEAHAEKLRQEKLEAKRLAKLEARKCDGSHAAFDDGDDEPETPAAPGKDDEAEAEAPPPFQRLEFLVRDWNEFDDDMSDDDMTKMMATYLEEVLQPRAADDLQFTREQIAACFTKLSCWLLPHPGFAVTKKSYDGAVGDIEPLFKRCVHGLMKHVFSEGLEPKLIGGAPLSAAELANYVRAYAGMFADGAKFPQAQTMLEATAEANNRNAAGAALEAYCETMDAARRGVEYLAHKELKAKFREARDGALLAFDTAATMGRKAAIADARAGLVQGSKRERNSQLQRLISRPFSTRFG
ncbi:guanylate-binding protein [Aureococcus anophagefferens]|nr:guanylate-binding protein [Aureococcus anophagefferens]